MSEMELTTLDFAEGPHLDLAIINPLHVKSSPDCLESISEEERELYNEG